MAQQQDNQSSAVEIKPTHEVGNPFKDRPCSIRVFDGLDHLKVAELNKKVVEDGTANIVVCGETRPFRFLARHMAFKMRPEDSCAIDLGCSTGETAAILSKRFKKVIGFDISSEVVSKGMADHPGLDLRVLDVLHDRRALFNVIEQEFAGNIPVFFIDIGGDRMHDIVVLYLAFLVETLPEPPVIIVKCRQLFRLLIKTRIQETVDAFQCPAADWDDLVKSTQEKELRERKTFHPQRYHLSLVPNTEKPICRYYNYSSCKKGETCPQDHEHCHFCLEKGHRGVDCTIMKSETIIRKKTVHA